MRAVINARRGGVAAGDVWSVFAQRPFRRLLTVRLTSQLGDGWFQAGLAGSVLFNPQRAASPLEIATAFAILLLPYSVIGPFAGVLLDRWSRRSVLVIANTTRAVLVLLTAVLIWRGSQGPGFVLSSLAIIAINRFFLSGLSASQPRVVNVAGLVTANSVATTLGTIFYTAGLASAGAAFRVIGANVRGYAAAAALTAVMYAGSAAMARAFFTGGALGPGEGERAAGSVLAGIVDTARGMVAGLGHLGRRRGAVAAVVAQAGHRALYGVLALATLLLYRNYFNAVSNVSGSLGGLGLVVAAGGLGALTAAVVTPPVARRVGGWRWITGLLATVAVLVPTFGLMFRPLPLIAAVFLINIAAQGIKIVVDTAIQLECDDDFRGRVFSVNDTAFNASFVIGLFAGALALPETGRSAGALIAVGVGYALLSTWYAVTGGRHARRAGDDIQTARRD